jgi:hypothetical protein
LGKKDYASSRALPNLATSWSEKQGWCSFTQKLIFNSLLTQTLRKTSYKPLLNQSMTFKNSKKKKNATPKPEIKKSFRSHICFCRCFQGKTTHILNSPYYMKSFDTKIYCFGGQNHLQPQLFFSTLESNDPLSFPTKKELEKKIKFRIKFKFLTIRRTSYLIDKKDRILSELHSPI